DCVSQEYKKSGFPAFFCDAATGSGQFEKDGILLTAEMDAPVLGIFRSHQPAAFIETPARMLGFFNDSESENFLHLGGSRAYEIVIIEQIKRKSINMEKRVFMN
ncbi:hypothetical protein Q3V10_002079, partial [Neisseria gonorrhoeae]